MLGIVAGATGAFLALRPALVERRRSARSDRARSELAAERSVLDERLAAAVKTLSSEALDANSTRFLELADSRLSGYVRPLKDSLERTANSRAWSESGRRPTASSPRTSACCEAIMIASASRPETSSRPARSARPRSLGRDPAQAGHRDGGDDRALRRAALDERRGRQRTEAGRHRAAAGREADRHRLKVPLVAYLDAVREDATDDERHARLLDHARHVREHIQRLGQKAYWRRLPATPEFVVMFLPDESFLRAAHEQDASLIELAVSNNVIPASPTNLIGLLRAVHYGWQQETIAESAREVSDLGRELYKRFATMGRTWPGSESRSTARSRPTTRRSAPWSVRCSSRRGDSSGTGSPASSSRSYSRSSASRGRLLRPSSSTRPRRHSKRSLQAPTQPREGTRYDVRAFSSAAPRSGANLPNGDAPVSDVRDVIIIGGGPAGYTAALYTARANLEPLVIEGFNWGGQLMITSDVENYPGYADGVLGPAMMADFRRQAERFGAEFVTDDVTRVDFSERPFRVYIGDEEQRADTIIVATGVARGSSASSPSGSSRAEASRIAQPVTEPSSATRSSSWSVEVTRRWRRRRS